MERDFHVTHDLSLLHAKLYIITTTNHNAGSSASFGFEPELSFPLQGMYILNIPIWLLETPRVQGPLADLCLSVQDIKLAIASLYTNYTTFIVGNDSMEQTETFIAQPVSGKLIIGVKHV